jgi:hypothetical protein
MSLHDIARQLRRHVGNGRPVISSGCDHHLIGGQWAERSLEREAAPLTRCFHRPHFDALDQRRPE